MLLSINIFILFVITKGFIMNRPRYNTLYFSKKDKDNSTETSPYLQDPIKPKPIIPFSEYKKQIYKDDKIIKEQLDFFV